MVAMHRHEDLTLFEMRATFNTDSISIMQYAANLDHLNSKKKGGRHANTASKSGRTKDNCPT